MHCDCCIQYDTFFSAMHSLASPQLFRAVLGRRRQQALLLCQIFLVFTVCDGILADDIGQEQTLSRHKRQYFDDGYYGNYYGWQIGRLVGWTLGFMVLMLLVCLPCVCCIGIWFAGWFGLRQAMEHRRRSQGVPPSGVAVQQMERRTAMHVDPPSPLAVPGDYRGRASGVDHRFVYAQDRFFERRPRSPSRRNSDDFGRETRRL